MSQAATESREKRRFQRRVRLVWASLWLGLALVAGRAAQLQFMQHERLSALARNQYLRKVKMAGRRGHIYDRGGKPLAISVKVPSVFANPQRVTDPRVAARPLASVLGVSLETLYERLARDRRFVWLERQVTPQVAQQIRDLELDGVYITQETKRFYPNRDLAAQLIGFVGVDGEGLEGIERAFNETLAGKPRAVVAMRDARGGQVLARRLKRGARGRGNDLYLTIDGALQHAAEKALREGIERTKASSGMAVALDVSTAEVLAMAVEPHFNPNDVDASDPASRRNRALTDMFEPGSTLKPLVVSAALDAGAVAEDDIVYCENGSMRIGGHTIRDSHAYGWLDVTGVIKKSSNIGAVKISQALGRARLAQALNRYGFGTETGVRFPGEAAGILRGPDEWSPVGAATVAFGHGIAVSALQLVAAYRALAAGGMYRRPTLIKDVEDARGRSIWRAHAETRRIVGRAAAAKTVQMLRAAVEPGGTGVRARVSGYPVAGKTGTAQKVDSVTGGYASDAFVASFVGFLPADDPRVVIGVIVDEPHHAEHTGGAAAAPIFAKIGAAAMQRLGVAPQAEAATVTTTDDSVDAPSGHSGGVEVVRAEPPMPAQRDGMPSFLGLTARQAVARHAELGLHAELRLRGSGRVVRQMPEPGATAAELERVELVLADGP